MIERAAEDDGKRPVLKEADLGLVDPDLQHILWRSHEISPHGDGAQTYVFCRRPRTDIMTASLRFG